MIGRGQRWVRWWALAGALIAGAWGAAEPFTFAALGCMPYGKENFAAYERLLAEINRRQPAFTVHCGDTKSGGEPPTEIFLKKVHTWFDSLDSAAIYTPGDNEWTDVHRTSNGNQDPAVWLGKVRAEYFSEEKSMGKKPIPLVTQRREKGFEKFVENARWTRGSVVFATVHVVGSNNNDQSDIPGAVAEFKERDAANAAWVRATFAEARATEAAGVAFFFQAAPFAQDFFRGGRMSGFKQFLDVMEAEARAWKKPVLLVHADEHRYRFDVGVKFERGAEPVPNVTRLETYGSGDIHGVLVKVDAASARVFECGPLIVPGNGTPSLPKKISN